MACNRNKFSISLLFLISQIVLTACDGIDAGKYFFSLSKNFNTSNAISSILSYNWTQNHECLIELNAIQSGLMNQDEWAMKGK